MTHDYKRHGTTTLFAALNVLDGMVIAQKMQQPPPRKGNSRTSAFASSMAAWPPFMSLESIRQWHKEPSWRASKNPRRLRLIPSASGWRNPRSDDVSPLVRDRASHARPACGRDFRDNGTFCRLATLGPGQRQ